METLKRFRGPHLGALAIIFTLLFNVGLSFVVSSGAAGTHFPGPWESAETIVGYFRAHSHDVMMCGFFQFCAAIPLGLFTVTAVSRFRFLGIKAVGPYISLFGGMLTCVALLLSGLLQWTMAYPGIADDAAVLRTLYYFSFGVGGVGYSVPMGLLIGGMAVTGGLGKVLPRWLALAGLLIAACGETSCLTLVYPNLLPLIPLTRFPGFIWLILAAFMLRKSR